jgi:hypothetical protein
MRPTARRGLRRLAQACFQGSEALLQFRGFADLDPELKDGAGRTQARGRGDGLLLEG